MTIGVYIITWICFSCLLGYYNIEHNILMSYCICTVLECINNIGNRDRNRFDD